jgi:GNAT superfamily N-acetyltransferase
VTAALTPVPPGHVAAVVTFLEMNRRPEPRPLPESPLRLEHWPSVDPERYRALFRRVGEKWLWFSRLTMDDTRLLAEIAEVHVAIDPAGTPAGLLELDFRTPGECLIRFLGLAPELAGRGHGRWLFAQALALCWRDGVDRVKVHTCSLDHPAALPAYLRAGFEAKSRAFEHFPDPRLAGLLPRDAAPQIPIVG